MRIFVITKKSNYMQVEKLRRPVNIDQRVGILCDGNNLEMGIHEMYSRNHVINFDEFVPNILKGRKLSHLQYFREGKSISAKLAERLQNNFFGTVTPCWKSADIALTIEAVQLADKVDTIIICSGDSDYIPLIEHLKSRGIRVEIAATENGLSPFMAKKADSVYKIGSIDCFALFDKRPQNTHEYAEEPSLGLFMQGNKEAGNSQNTFRNSTDGDAALKVHEGVRLVCDNGLSQSEEISEN